MQDSEAVDILNASGFSCQPDTLPFKLRPAKENITYQQSVRVKKHNDCNNENIIANIQKLASVFQTFSAHQCSNPEIIFDITDRYGLCVSVNVKCTKCKFETGRMPLYTTMKAKRGPDTGCSNTAILLPVMQSKLGISDLQLVLACLNIRAPDPRGMQRKLNQLSASIQEMSKQQMLRNQEYVKRIQEQSGCNTGTDVEYDVAYTSRPQGGGETATQSFASVIEQTTTRHLPIAMETANKTCLLRNCSHDTGKCSKNYSSNHSISSSETRLLKEAMNSISNTKYVTVGAITTDGSAQIAKAIREIKAQNQENGNLRHYNCFVHKMRCFYKQMKTVKLSTKLPRGQTKTVFKQKLASSLRVRVRLELTRLRRQYKAESDYLQHSLQSCENILKCFQGNHTGCRKYSVVCKAHLKCYKKSYLPYGQYLKLSEPDMQRVRHMFQRYVNEGTLRASVKLTSTNQCESLNSRLFSFVPKSTVWSRNFNAKAHAVILTASVGRGLSLLQIANGIGLPFSELDPIFLYANNTDKTAKYQAKRKATSAYKTFVFMSRKRRSNRSLLETSIYANNQNLNQEHSYGINPNI